MKNKIDWVKVAGIACTIIGFAVSIANSLIEDKKLDAKIEEKIGARLNNLPSDS